MKASCKATLIVLAVALLLGCAGSQQTSTTTDRLGNPCPQWQSHANCMKNH